MIFSNFLYLLLFLSSSIPVSVDTYDWSTYESAAKQVDEAVSKIVEAHLIINNDLTLDINLLPQKTKSQIAILQDAAYLEWLMAEENLGKTEAAKYWDKFNTTKDFGDRLMCFQEFEKGLGQYHRKMYSLVDNCEHTTRTACHLNIIQQRIDLNMNFYQCMGDKYGDWDSPLKPKGSKLLSNN